MARVRVLVLSGLTMTDTTSFFLSAGFRGVLGSLVVGLGILLPLRSGAEGVIGLAGEGYGAAEIQSIIKNVIDREMGSVVYEVHEGLLPVEEFAKYRLVVLAGANSERTYNAEESEKVNDYVAKGGRLVLIQQAPKNFSMTGGNRDSDFLFGRSYYMRDRPECTVYEPESPLLEGALEPGERPFWLRGSVLLKSPEWENIIGHNEFILVGKRTIGEGTAYYLGSELFRLLIEVRAENADKADGWIRILKNILSEPASEG